MRILMCYQTVTPESAEEGDFDDQGIKDEVSITIDDPSEFETRKEWWKEIAVNLFQAGAYYLSSSCFHVGVWYISCEEEDYITGGSTTYSWHLKEFSPEDEKGIYDAFMSIRK